MRTIIQFAALAASILATPSFSALSTFSPLSSSSGPSYSIGLPPSSSISSTSTGTIYLQIKAPSTLAWAAFGIGEQMAGARIFLVYADGKGNVTVSARKGAGHVQPQNDATLQKGVEILEGTGIVDGEMRANLKVSSSALNSDKSSTESPFIAAWSEGNPLNSDSPSASIRKHSSNTYRQFTFDLTRAVLSSDGNPFVGSSLPSPKENNKNNSNVVGKGNSKLESYQKAHGIIMGLVVLLLFPLGALFIRLGGGMIGHAALQSTSLFAMMIGFGLGIKLGDMTGLLYNTTHTIFGTVTFALFLIQPVLGVAHHILYKRHNSRTPVSYFHIWYGRLIITFGIINGGLGLKLAANSKVGEVVYGIAAVFVVLGYAVLVFTKQRSRGRTMSGGKERNREGEEGIRLNNRKGYETY